MAVTARAGSGTGGSAKSGEIRAGGAFVELFAKSGKLSQDLNKASEEVGKFGLQAGKVAGGQIAAAIGGPIGLAVAALGVAMKAIGDEFILPARQFAKEMERSTELSEKSLARFEKRLTEVRARIAEFASEAGTGNGLKKYSGELSTAEKELSGLESTLKATQKQMGELDSIFNSPANFSLWLGAPVTGGLEGERAKIQPALDEIKKQYEQQLELITELRKQQREHLDPTQSREAMKAVRDYTKEIQEQLDITKGLNRETAEQAKLRKLADQFGFKPGTPEFDNATRVAGELNTARANKSLQEFAEALDEQRAAIEDPTYDPRRADLEKMLADNPSADAAAVKRARDAIRDINAAEAVEAAAAWGESFREIAPWALGQPQAVWGSFSGSGSMVNPAKAFQDEQLKLGEEGNKLLAQVRDELKNMEPWIL